ncbi:MULTISPECIES: threonine/serine exporter ThrE family protein [unclassified Bradyrhizobium]|uniref:threonine/serine ThrE exporter family protein n=1 Tax=unclassified Bradyrhizobium TaxID=2631580 RepID=UPI001BACCBD1|nr:MULTISPECIES: threonine/serine exporter family protein [unclassified Bradyrhizobium]MBR1206079.1 threonine/serine exporter family protein [Bradyrhizobium sp. AUGA SZCCT0124]MBR1314795.1 threonine/serine exporter family protein [Bradyrhizobium sp. AUGA SZCCT0051]MBR1341766.1 threonine/serine exporter family protein [Bradyrhizobium sp. AUGA SZCCT0105]MBR1358833.1 threonine/serine exporter family protein [Bradyrhizobium sp. AUGA SZCCT0045]
MPVTTRERALAASSGCPSAPGLAFDFGPPANETSLGIVALAAALLFKNGQTTERMAVTVERLGQRLGLPVRVLPDWDKLTIEIDGTSLSQTVPTKPLGVDMNRVLAVSKVIDRLCDGSLRLEEARPALLSAGNLPPVSTLRFTSFAATGAASLGVIFGALDMTSLILIAASAALGALVRRCWLSGLGTNPFTQPLCAALIAGSVAVISSTSLHLSSSALVAFCPCMVLVPGPHLLNGAIDLVRTRIALGIARLAYAGVVLLMICVGLLLGFTAGGGVPPAAGSSAPVPFLADVIAAGCAVASFGTLFSMPWRTLPFPIVAGMVGHAARWALISLAGTNVATGALAACILISIIVTPVVDRLHLPFAALGFSAVVSMIPGFFLFTAASAVVALISAGPQAPITLLTDIAVNGVTAILVILAMTFGLILPRMLLERRHS